jgi:glycosyltransferase involved in cell wall biosynthesis
MKIAQIAPLWETVPPPAYGGTELVVSLLTEGLVKKGHDVTLFASADSVTSANLIVGNPQPLRSAGLTIRDYYPLELLRLSKLVALADNFDVIHSHIDAPILPFAKLIKTPIVHTVHGVIPNYMEKLFAYHKSQTFISISNSQRRNDLGLNYKATVYNGINVSTYRFYAKPESPAYLAFLGRISAEKGTHLAIELAKKTGWNLKIAGKIDAADKEYFESQVKPYIDGTQIVYLGEATHAQKSEIMGNAYATLCLITWDEPFGLVVPESMACGTPVIAINRGSMPELIRHGENGFLCNTLEECIRAMTQIPKINRYACRHHVEKNFSSGKMVDKYEEVYYRVANKVSIMKNNYFTRKLTAVNDNF